MTITFAYSPCPNDTFMFEPIFSGKIDTRGIHFEVIHDEVEQLNLASFTRTYDVSKLSFNAFTKVIDRYQMLQSGAALGENCGPILVAKEPISADELSGKKVAIPGINTTANLMLSLALPEVGNKVEIVFSDIEQAVLTGVVDAGLIIHESRFTYADKGLVKLLDVGEYWEETTGTPIPLGGIAVARDLPEELKSAISDIIRESVAYAFAHPTSGIDYIKQHAQEMDEAVMYAHIDLYVNEYSKTLGSKGRDSIKVLIDKLVAKGLLQSPSEQLFVDQ